MSAAAMALRGRYIGALGRVGRAGAERFAASFAAMTAAFLAMAAIGETVLVGTVAGVGFLGMFVGAFLHGSPRGRTATGARYGVLVEQTARAPERELRPVNERPNEAADERRVERRDRPHDRRGTVAVDRARGGFSLWSVLSGVLVAFGAFVVIAAIVGALFGALGIAERGLRTEDLTAATIGAGVGVVIVQFLAYLWGGYTAGRMARGSGVLNGILVPVVALVIVIVLAAILAAVLGADVREPDVQRLPLPLSTARDIGSGVGIGLIVAMLAGGALGGWLGTRWHTKLENTEADTQRAY